MMRAARIFITLMALTLMLNSCSTCGPCGGTRVETNIRMCLSERPDAAAEASNCIDVDLSVLVTH